MDKTGTPQDLNTALTNGDNNGASGQTTFNKIRIDENRFKSVNLLFMKNESIDYSFYK